jgi:hypothetical protein
LQWRPLATLSEARGMLAWAVTIPNASLRANMHRLVSRHWTEGPQAIRPLIIAPGGPVEPGVLVMLKSLDRENRRSKLSASGFSRLSAKAKAEEEKKSKLSEDWNVLLDELIRDYCHRCHLAALAQMAAAYRSGSTRSVDALAVDSSLPLPAGSVPSAAYRFDWPGRHATRLPQSADETLQLRYIRIEERGKPSRQIGHYRRQVKSGIERQLPNGTRLDVLTDQPDSNRVQAVDVLLTRTGDAASGSKSDDTQPLTIEILSIEVPKVRE